MARQMARLSAAVLSVFLATGPVQADDYIEWPEVRTDLPSFEACLARLEERAAADAAKAGERDGLLIEVLGSGVIRERNGSARYEATLWYHAAKFDAERGQTVTAHSYEDYVLICDGAVLTENGGQGFTIETFEPLVD